MNNVIGTIRKFETKQFQIIVDAIEDDDFDLSWDDSGEIKDGIESGKYIYFTARVRVFYDGRELAADYLGGCIYETMDAFMDHKECGRQNREFKAQGKDERCGSYFVDMVRNVCDEARKAIGKMQSVRVRAI